MKRKTKTSFPVNEDTNLIAVTPAAAKNNNGKTKTTPLQPGSNSRMNWICGNYLRFCQR
jgi:hypothetical protein